MRSLFCQPIKILPTVKELETRTHVTYPEFYLFVLLMNLYLRTEQIWESYIPLALKEAEKSFPLIQGK